MLVDDFENYPAGWTNSAPVGWLEAPAAKSYSSYYLVEWRGKTKYDSMAQTAYVTTYSDDDEWQVERVPYNIPGALVYYRNTRRNTYALRPNHADSPSYGPKYQLLVVDMNPRPLRRGPSSTLHFGPGQPDGQLRRCPDDAAVARRSPSPDLCRLHRTWSAPSTSRRSRR